MAQYTNTELLLPISDESVLGDISVATFDKMDECFRVTESIIKHLDDGGLAELLSGSLKDIDELFEVIYEETYKALYGNHGAIKSSSFQYLDSLTAVIDETYRIESIAYFISSVLVDFEMNWHHLEWCQFIQLYQKVCIIAARDHGKSYFFSYAYPAWKMYRYRPIDPNDQFPRKDLNLSHRGFILTNEMDLTKDLIEILKDNIEANDVLRERLYPGTKDGWAKENIKCKNGARLGGKSYGGSFRGRHPGYLICDDYLRENVIYSATQRQKSVNYFHATLMNAVLKKGQTLVAGTPMHENDIYGDLKTRKTWRYFEYPAVFPDGTVLWESRYNLNDLLDDRDDQGSLIFAREKLVRPIVSETSIFPLKTVKRALENMDKYTLVNDLDEFPKVFEVVSVGVDLAISANVGADYTYYTVWGIDEFDHFWLLYAYKKKGMSYGDQLNKMRSLDMRFQPDVFCIEDNQFQAVIGDMGEEELGLPVYKHNTGTNKYNFKYGLPSLSVLFERGKFHFPYGDDKSKKIVDNLISEFTSITWTDKGLEGVGEHDDGVMSAWKGVVGSRQIKSLGLDFL